jgi:hypothetical protein
MLLVCRRRRRMAFFGEEQMMVSSRWRLAAGVACLVLGSIRNVSSIFAKLQVTDRPAAIIRARDAGLGS